ncbi:unnamed protein product [Bursaphelenchus xylophilus]|nr:unnamed protein product [Bursaphelenchus xylophilus]CAG9095811.1 unnamed protein product [Bursaphelenchus xylophilus]
MNLLPLNDTYIVLSSDLNFYYLLHVPVAAMYWIGKGVKVLLVIVLKENEDADDRDFALVELLNFLEGEMNVKVIYYRNYTIPSSQFSQTVRAFAAGSEFAHTLDPDKTVFVTSDVDFFPRNISSHIPKTHQGKEIMTYGTDGNDWIRWLGEKYHMYSMTSVGMTLRRWREVVGIPHDRPVDGKFIDSYVNKTFDERIHRKTLFWQWFLDQRFLSLKIKHWIDKNEEKFRQISERSVSGERLDRKHWPGSEELEKMNLWERYESAHLTPGIIHDQVWNANMPFYKKIFTEDQIKQLAGIRERVLSARDIKKYITHWYHPEFQDAFWKTSFNIKDMLNKTQPLT